MAVVAGLKTSTRHKEAQKAQISGNPFVLLCVFVAENFQDLHVQS